MFPEQLFGLNIGEAFIFRTIAGHPQPVFNDLIQLDIESHGWENLIVLYHTGKLIQHSYCQSQATNQATDCGTLRFDEERIRRELIKTSPADEAKVKNMQLAGVKKCVFPPSCRSFRA